LFVLFSFSVGGQRVVGGDQMLLYSLRWDDAEKSFVIASRKRRRRRRTWLLLPPFPSSRCVQYRSRWRPLDSTLRVFPLQRRLFFCRLQRFNI